MNRSSRTMFAYFVCFAGLAMTVCWLMTKSSRQNPVEFGSSGTKKSASTESVLVNGGKVFVDKGQIADAGIKLANRYTGEILNPDSLQELQTAILKRSTSALAGVSADLESLEQSLPHKDIEVSRLYYQKGTLLTYEGRFDEAVKAIETSQSIGATVGMPAETLANLTAVLGIIAFRKGEVDNCIGCVGPSSCILPISSAAIHTKPAGSRQAIKYFTEYLDRAPGDLRIRWMLNLAYMTVGEYPDGVPPIYLVPSDIFASKADVGRFRNVAPESGLISRGPNQAGGSLFDDFTGDGLPDLFFTSLDVDRGASFFVNMGNGHFEDHSDHAGLADERFRLEIEGVALIPQASEPGGELAARRQ